MEYMGVNKIEMIMELIRLVYQLSPKETNEILKKFGEEALTSNEDVRNFIEGLERNINNSIKMNNNNVNKWSNEYG